MDALTLGTRGKKLAIVQVSLLLCSALTAVSLCAAIGSILVTDAFWSLSLLGVAQFALFGVGAPINAALLSIAPTSLRSLAISIAILVFHLLGDLSSPFLFGYVSDQILAAGGDMRLSMALLSSWLLWAVLFWLAAACVCQHRRNQLRKHIQQHALWLIDPSSMRQQQQHISGSGGDMINTSTDSPDSASMQLSGTDSPTSDSASHDYHSSSHLTYNTFHKHHKQQKQEAKQKRLLLQKQQQQQAAASASGNG